MVKQLAHPLVVLACPLPHVGHHSVILHHLLVAGLYSGAGDAGEEELLPDGVEIVEKCSHMAACSYTVIPNDIITQLNWTPPGRASMPNRHPCWTEPPSG